jgi:hypothetical protein
VEQAPRRAADLLLRPLDRGLQVASVTLLGDAERQPLLKVRPGWIVRLGDAEPGHGIPGVRPELLLGHRERLRCRSDDAITTRQQPGRVQVEQPRQQLALG